jgi:hypothetical protein
MVRLRRITAQRIISRHAAKQLRCEVWAIPEGDRTGENAIECGSLVLACAECGNSCDSCADEHRCLAEVAAKSESKRAA